MKTYEHIPVGAGEGAFPEPGEVRQLSGKDKFRILLISAYAIGIAMAVSLVAKLLVLLIDLITNLAFFGNFSVHEARPSENTLGWWGALVPVAGGLVVGVMALYGSRAIRGHGIPEAMEQILVNQSRINPAITILKPLSSAVAIGTGGPFGAEGPIIATGGALGSTLGQLLRISQAERKLLLAAGATAGMSAIFGTPMAAIFLAIELLLFEFTPKAILAVALACITGAAGHHLLFGSTPVFEIKDGLKTASNTAIFCYSFIGLLTGAVSVGVTKAVYMMEEGFEKLGVHWVWWPAIGGVAVGLIGLAAPRTLGVGYYNITDLLNAEWPLRMVLALCFLKFLSWVIALGSGTSGGTLAPLLTIGAALGVLAGKGLLAAFPACGVDIRLAALVGMAAMFAGASRALLASIAFALETSGQFQALLPLLGSCVAAYGVSYLSMGTTIMTEKITRRGVYTPDSYTSDLLSQLQAGKAAKPIGVVLEEQETVQEARNLVKKQKGYQEYYVVRTPEGAYGGVVSAALLFRYDLPLGQLLRTLAEKPAFFLNERTNLRQAMATMSEENSAVLPVISADKNLTGLLSHRDILAYVHAAEKQNDRAGVHLSVRRTRIRLLARGRKMSGRVRKNKRTRGR